MKHGEQLAPLIERVLRDAGVGRQDLTAMAVGTGPGPFTGLRVGLVTARTLAMVLDIPAYGVCTLDAIALEAAAGLRHRTASWWRPTRGARRSTSRRTTSRAPRLRPGRRPAGRRGDRPARGRRGRAALPRAFTRPVAPALPSAGWLAQAVVDERVELDRPRAALPAPSRRRGAGCAQAGHVTIRAATEADVAAVVRLEEVCLGDDAWSPGLVAEGIGRDCRRCLPGGRGRRRPSWVTRWRASPATTSSCSGSPSTRRTAAGPGQRAARRGRDRAAAAGGTRLVLEVRDDNATATAFYESRGFAEMGRRRAYYRDGAAAVVLGKKIGYRDGTATVTLLTATAGSTSGSAASRPCRRDRRSGRSTGRRSSR